MDTSQCNQGRNSDSLVIYVISALGNTYHQFLDFLEVIGNSRNVYYPHKVVAVPIQHENDVQLSKSLCMYSSGQIIATSHDLTPNGGLVREIPLFQGNLGW